MNQSKAAELEQKSQLMDSETSVDIFRLVLL